MDIQVELSRVLITELSDQQVIILKEINGDRAFPIVIGTPEALAIDRRIKGQSLPRPMTHDLLENVITSLDSRLDRIVIESIKESTFIANLYIDTPTGEISIDARPSDAIALGSGLDTPIYVCEKVLNLATNPKESQNQRIELLKQRMDMLKERIEVLQARINDKDLTSQLPETIVNEQKKQLQDMQTEFKAIEEVLRKFDQM